MLVGRLHGRRARAPDGRRGARAGARRLRDQPRPAADRAAAAPGRVRLRRAARLVRGLAEAEPPLLARGLAATSRSSSSREMFPEPHSTKQLEDCVEWAMRRGARDHAARVRLAARDRRRPGRGRGGLPGGAVPGARHHRLARQCQNPGARPARRRAHRRRARGHRGRRAPAPGAGPGEGEPAAARLPRRAAVRPRCWRPGSAS